MKTRISFFKSSFIFIGLFFFFNSVVIAQQLPIALQGRDNISILNPAAIGYEYFFYGRKLGFQTTSINYPVLSDLSPKTFLAHGYYIIDKKDLGTKILLGINFMSDDEEFTKTTSSQIRLAGIFPLSSERERIVIGFSGGVGQFEINTDNINLVDAGDAIGESGLTQWYPEVSLGVFYSNLLANDNYLYAGVSIPQVFSLDKIITNDAGTFDLEKRHHYAANIGFKKIVTENRFFEPSFRVIYLPDFPIFFTGNIKYQLISNFWAEGGLSNNGFGNIGFGLTPNFGKTKNQQLSFSASFEMPIFAQEFTPFGRRLEVTAKWTR